MKIDIIKFEFQIHFIICGTVSKSDYDSAINAGLGDHGLAAKIADESGLDPIEAIPLNKTIHGESLSMLVKVLK